MNQRARLRPAMITGKGRAINYDESQRRTSNAEHRTPNSDKNFLRSTFGVRCSMFDVRRSAFKILELRFERIQVDRNGIAPTGTDFVRPVCSVEIVRKRAAFGIGLGGFVPVQVIVN